MNRHIIYDRKDLMVLLEELREGFIMDDEAITSGYKRNFADSDQKMLVQMLNMYRNHGNVYSLCIPSFYSLDKDLRDLIKIHIHVIERGLAVVHIAREDVLYSEDHWDIAYNKKIEETWALQKKKRVDWTPPYHKLTTFAGYLRYRKLPVTIEERYEHIKETKRKKIYETKVLNLPKSIEELTDEKIKRMVQLVKSGGVTLKEIEKFAHVEGLTLSTVNYKVNKFLKEDGILKSMKQMLKQSSIDSRFEHNKRKLNKMFLPANSSNKKQKFSIQVSSPLSIVSGQ